MILLDANVLLYAYDASSPQHERARSWLERTLSDPQPVLFPWATVLAFLRIATNPRAFQYPLRTDEAIAIVSSWLARPNVSVVQPTDRHWTLLAAALHDAQVRGPLVTDAHLAALAVEHGATLATTDRDFARFKDLSTLDPLAS